jgi:hypothetical protein
MFFLPHLPLSGARQSKSNRRAKINALIFHEIVTTPLGKSCPAGQEVPDLPALPPLV